MLPKFTQNEIVQRIKLIIEKDSLTIKQKEIFEALNESEKAELISERAIWTAHHYKLAATLLQISEEELTSMLPEEDLSSVSFRAKENTEEILNKVSDINDIFESLAYQVKLSNLKFEEPYSHTIKRVQPYAEAFIKEKSLVYPIQDSMKVLSDLGYYIIKGQAPTNLSGFYMKKDRYPFIFVNTNHSLGRQNFSLWHEVYHHFSNHRNGVSDFNTKSMEEREAEIFAGLILLPDHEVYKWSNKLDLSVPDNIAKLSEYYQMSFNAVAIRLWQAGIFNYKTFDEKLRPLSKVENQTQLHDIYERNQLNIEILEPTKNISISSNIQDLLQKNYQQQKVSTDYINQLIHQIEVLNNNE